MIKFRLENIAMQSALWQLPEYPNDQTWYNDLDFTIIRRNVIQLWYYWKLVSSLQLIAISHIEYSLYFLNDDLLTMLFSTADWAISANTAYLINNMRHFFSHLRTCSYHNILGKNQKFSIYVVTKDFLKKWFSFQ